MMKHGLVAWEITYEETSNCHYDPHGHDVIRCRCGLEFQWATKSQRLYPDRQHEP
jgi:hypothetical protein